MSIRHSDVYCALMGHTGTSQRWEELRDYRAALGLSRAQLADQAGISAPFMADLENGRRGPSPETLVALARVCGVDPLELWRSRPPVPTRRGQKQPHVHVLRTEPRQPSGINGDVEAVA